MKDITTNDILIGLAYWIVCCAGLATIGVIKKRQNEKAKAKEVRSNLVMFDDNGIMVFEKGQIKRGMVLTDDEKVQEIEKIFNKSPEVHRLFVDAAVNTVLQSRHE